MGNKYVNIYRINEQLTTNTDFATDFADLVSFYQTTDGVPPPLYTPPQPPQFTLSPGIIYSEQKIDTQTIPTEQILGVGQGLALRLLTDISSHPYGDINVTELRNRINFSIDENDCLNISCVSGSTFPQTDISNISLEGKKIATMIFNVFDASGWLKQGEEINLNFTRNVSGQRFTIDKNTIFDISGTSSLSVFRKSIGELVENLNSFDTLEISDSSYNIEISNNNLNLILRDESYNDYKVKNFSFNLVDSSNIDYLLKKTDINLNIKPATSYILTSDNSFNFIVDYSNNIGGSTIDLSHNHSVTIGNISNYNYLMQNGDLGPKGGYFNINQINYGNNDNLITLTNNNNNKIGKIYRI